MGWNEGDVTIDGGVRLHYYRRGSGRPLILAHGFSDNGECWTRVAEAIEGDCDIVAYDARYHGLSDAPPELAPGSAGTDLIALVDALGVERPAIMGHSMGAAAVMAAAGTAPERFVCAILEDPYLRMESTTPTSASPQQAPATPPFPDLSNVPLRKIEAGGRKDNPTWDASEFAPWARSKQQFRRPPGESTPPAPGAWRQGIERMHLPTLLIYGGNRERYALVSERAATEAKALNPQLTAVRLDNAGHNVRREAFEPFVAAVRAFLAEHP